MANWRNLDYLLDLRAKSLGENNASTKYLYIYIQNYIRRYIQSLSIMFD